MLRVPTPGSGAETRELASAGTPTQQDLANPLQRAGKGTKVWSWTARVLEFDGADSRGLIGANGPKSSGIRDCGRRAKLRCSCPVPVEGEGLGIAFYYRCVPSGAKGCIGGEAGSRRAVLLTRTNDSLACKPRELRQRSVTMKTCLPGYGRSRRALNVGRGPLQFEAFCDRCPR